MLIRILSTFLPRIPDAIWNVAPTLPAKVTFYWADPTWEMEDGTSAQSGPVPLGLDLTITYTLQLGNQFVAIAGNSSMNIANYHSHYPEHDNLQDLLQVPPGIHCGNRIYGTDGNVPPQTPPVLPSKFHLRSESIFFSSVGKDTVYYSEDYYDYDNQMFRFDVSLHRPDHNGPVILRMMHDYANSKFSL